MSAGASGAGRGPAEAPETRAEIVGGLTALLLSRGVPGEEIEAAVSQDRIDLLVIDQLLLPPSPPRTGYEVVEAVGIPLEQADRLWRALGFADPHGSPVFNDEDIEALRTLQGLVELGLSSPETSVQVTRVLGSSMARLSDALVSAADVAATREGSPEWVTSAEDEGLRLAEVLALSAEVVLPSMEKLIVYAWRRHIQAAAHRRASLRRAGAVHSPMLTELTVGFADMVGFTALSSQLNANALARVVDRFEELAHSIVVEGGGRAVKMIGDEVMFVASEPMEAVRIALNLVDAYADDDLLSDVRVGLATGPVLQREGDFFGAVVNRASRIVNIADAGTILVSEEVRDCIVAVASGPAPTEPAVAAQPADVCESSAEGDEARRFAAALVLEPLKPRVLKDIGRVALWSVRRTDQDAASEDRRSGIRWRRMSSISAELEALRQSGERVFESLITPRAAAVEALAVDVAAVSPVADSAADPAGGSTSQAARILPQGSAS